MECMVLRLPEAAYLSMGLAVQALVRASSLRGLPGAIVLVWTRVLIARGGRHPAQGLGTVLRYVGASLILVVLFWPEAVPFGQSWGAVEADQVCSYAAVADRGAIQTAADTRQVPPALLTGPVDMPPGFRLLLRAMTETPLAASEHERSRKLGQGAHRKISAVNGTVLFWCAKNGTFGYFTPNQTVKFWPQTAQFCMSVQFSSCR